MEDRAKQVEDAVGRAVAGLSEFVDNVQILVSYIAEDRNTMSYTEGVGNWLARVEQARGFVSEHDNADIINAINGLDDEEWMCE